MGLAEGHRSQLGAWLGGHFAGPAPLNAAIVLPSIASTTVSRRGFLPWRFAYAGPGARRAKPSQKLTFATSVAPSQA